MAKKRFEGLLSRLLGRVEPSASDVPSHSGVYVDGKRGVQDVVTDADTKDFLAWLDDWTAFGYPEKDVSIPSVPTEGLSPNEVGLLVRFAVVSGLISAGFPIPFVKHEFESFLLWARSKGMEVVG